MERRKWEIIRRGVVGRLGITKIRRNGVFLISLLNLAGDLRASVIELEIFLRSRTRGFDVITGVSNETSQRSLRGVWEELITSNFQATHAARDLTARPLSPIKLSVSIN